jgi:hypothetical protein
MAGETEMPQASRRIFRNFPRVCHTQLQDKTVTSRPLHWCPFTECFWRSTAAVGELSSHVLWRIADVQQIHGKLKDRTKCMQEIDYSVLRPGLEA